MDNKFFIEQSSIVNNTVGDFTAKVYKECRIDNSRLGKKTTIGDYSRVFDSYFAENVIIQRNAMIFSTIFGDYTYTGKNFVSWYSKIGKFCSISWNVSIGGANHDYERVTTHPMLYSNDFGFLEGNEPMYNRFDDDCIIGNDVWIGANACICRGITVGDGAVIAAGAVVTKNVEPYTIVGGVPAKPIKKRFSDDIIEILLKTKWWDFPKEIIAKNINLFGKKMNIDVAKELLEIRKQLNK